MFKAMYGVMVAGCLVCGGLAGLAPAQVRAQQPEIPVERIEQIVRELLLREPEIIYDALQELRARQDMARLDQQKTAIGENRERLFADPKTPFGGEADAEVTLVEFFDYRCTYCRRVVSSLRALMDEEDDLKVVFKELPVLGADSVTAARAALASRNQDKYLPFHFALMQASDLSSGGIMQVAREVGLDPERLARDMEDPAIQEAIDDNYALANELGIEGTPAFVIGDQMIPGAIDQAQLRQLIEQQREG